MMSMSSPIEIGVVAAAAGGAVATFVVSRRALSARNNLGSPTVLAAAVAGLSFFGLLSMGPIILIPFVALALTCLVLPFVRFLVSQGVFQQREEPPEVVAPPHEPLIPRASPPSPPPRPTPPMSAKPILPLDIIPPGLGSRRTAPRRPKQ